MSATRKPRVLIVDADAALGGLLEEWLRAARCTPTQLLTAGLCASNGYDLVIVDVAFPRQAGSDTVQRISRELPGTPILVLSSSFFAGIETSGAVARSLGVNAVLPKPLKREALLDAIRQILHLPQ